MSAQAQGARTAAAATLQDTIRDVKRYIQKEEENLSKRLLQSKLEKLTVAKNDLFGKHCYYAEKAGLDISTNEDLLDYINPLMDGASDTLDAIELLLEDLDNAAETNRQTNENAAIENAKKNELAVAEKQCLSDEQTLRANVVAMLAIVNDENMNSKEDATHVRAYLNQIEETLRDLTKSWNMFKLLNLTNEKLDELFATQQTVRKYIADNVVLAESFVAKVDPEHDITRTIDTSSTTSTHGDSSTLELNKFFQMEKSKKPIFSGDIRNYARFKSDFMSFVAPTCRDKQHQSYVLKTDCLRGAAQNLVYNMSDIDSIWERLEGRYGDEVDIVNVIIKGVQEFPTIKSDHDRSLVKLVDQLEKGVEDLDAIDAKQQLANALTVKVIEEKLPRQVLTRWFEREILTVRTTDQRFNELFSFLKQERKQAEKLLLLHEKKNDSSNNRDRGNRNQERNQERGNRNQDHQEQHLANGAAGEQNNLNRNNSCLIHREANHHTQKCHKFRSMNVNQRGKVVLDSNGCKLCLSTSHGTDPCPFEATWEKCNIDGCQLYHSRLIHGCTIAGFNAHITASVPVNAVKLYYW